MKENPKEPFRQTQYKNCFSHTNLQSLFGRNDQTLPIHESNYFQQAERNLQFILDWLCNYFDLSVTDASYVDEMRIWRIKF